MKKMYVYAIRDKQSKEVKGAKCEGGSFYKIMSACERKCKELNEAHTKEKYEVGKYAVIPVENIAGVLIKDID